MHRRTRSVNARSIDHSTERLARAPRPRRRRRWRAACAACRTVRWRGSSSRRRSCCCWRSTSFPLLWTIRLSFTNYRANRPNAPLTDVGIDHYVSILGDADVWAAMQATAHFVFWTILLQTLIGFALA